MAICAIQVKQSDGSYLFGPDPNASDLATCSYVVESGPDFGSSFFQMTASDGGTYSAAIVSVWIGAWIFKMLIKTLNGDRNDSES